MLPASNGLVPADETTLEEAAQLCLDLWKIWGRQQSRYASWQICLRSPNFEQRHTSSWFISYCSWFSPPFFVQVQLSTGEATEQGDIYNGVVILDVAHGINPSLLPTCQVKRCPHRPGSLRFSPASLHGFESSNWNGLLSSGSSAGSSTCAKQNLHDSRIARFFGRSTCST